MDYTREDPIIPLKEATRFIAECLVAAGAIKQAAIAQARVLVEADRQGHFSHGKNIKLNLTNMCLCFLTCTVTFRDESFRKAYTSNRKWQL